MKDHSNVPPLSKKKEYLILIAFFIAYSLIYFFSIQFSKGNNAPKIIVENTELFGVTFYIVEFITFCAIYFIILPKLFDFRNWKKIALLIISSFCIFILTRYSIEQILTSVLFGIINYHEKTPFLHYIIENIFYGSTIVFITIFIWTIVHLIKTLQQKNVFEQEKNEAEIKFLKAQINPHFLFNTLNNIYSLVSINSEKSLKAIENFSAIMRFTTYETSKDKIPLITEIVYINQYLDLEQIRYGDSFFIEKNILLQNNSTQIHPYIISPLIENALKHGVVKDKNHPIEIVLKTTDDFLEISVKNKINPKQKDDFSGIGLTNLKRRLNHYFENNYTFEINNNYETFHIYLKIPIDVKN